MTEFRIEVKYQVGKKNIVVDKLSRRVDYYIKLIEEEVMVEWLKK
jgi:hypothetical protein